MISETIEIKHKDNSIYKAMGILFIMVALFNIGGIIFLAFEAGSHLRYIVYMFAIVSSINIILNLFMGLQNLKMPRINYIEIDKEQISIYKGPVRKRKNVLLKDIEEGRILGDRLILICSNEKEIEIDLNLIKIRDSDKIRVVLEKEIKIDILR